MNLVKDISYKGSIQKTFHCIIEIPAKSQIKYEYDERFEIFRVKREMWENKDIWYPFNYGFIPQTMNKDEKQPLDVFVITTTPLLQGTLIDCIILGYFEVLDNGKKDNKFVAIPKIGFTDLKNVSYFKEYIKEFLLIYKSYLPKEKNKVEVKDFHGEEDAIKLIIKAHKDFYLR